MKITCRSPSSPIISVWHESRYKPGLEVEDAKRLVRDAIAARTFNDMVSLEPKSYNDTNSPSTPPYAKLKLEKNCFFLWVEEKGWACMVVKKAQQMQMRPKTFVHDCG